MYKLNFTISLNSFTNLNRYAKSLNLPVTTIIRFILVEQIHYHNLEPKDFECDFDKCQPRETSGTIDSYGKEKKPKTYSLIITEYIYDNISYIKRKFKEKYEKEGKDEDKVTTNTVINNLLHIGIQKKLEDFDPYYSTEYHALCSNTKQYSVPMSSAFTNRLQDISTITGIKINQLISLIIGNYLIEHFSEYDNNIYINPETSKEYRGIW